MVEEFGLNETVFRKKFMILLQFSWRRGSKDSSVCFLKDCISALNILSISAMSF
jgi:hypothetical protein